MLEQLEEQKMEFEDEFYAWNCWECVCGRERNIDFVWCV